MNNGSNDLHRRRDRLHVDDGDAGSDAADANRLGESGPTAGRPVGEQRNIAAPGGVVYAVQAGNQRVYQLPPPALPPTPRELPLDVYGFAGRVGELDELDAMLAEDVQASSPVVISAVSGTAGVGKTALAVHWAHRRASQFPDGILYVDLRGYDPDEPVPAGEALAAFLRALGVRGAEIPLEPAERAARYRTLLSGRRMLGSALK